MSKICGANIQIQIVRGGTFVTFQPMEQSGHGMQLITDSDGNYRQEQFIVPGEFNPDTIGREIVAAMVGARMEK